MRLPILYGQSLAGNAPRHSSLTKGLNLIFPVLLLTQIQNLALGGRQSAAREIACSGVSLPELRSEVPNLVPRLVREVKERCQLRRRARQQGHLSTNHRHADAQLMPAFQARGRQPNEALSTPLRILLCDDFTRKCIPIDTTLSQNVNAVVSIQYSSIGPRFQTIPLT